MAESKRRPRWRYLGPTGGMLVALAVVLALLTSPAPVPRVHPSSLRTQDVGAQASTSVSGSNKAGSGQATGTAAKRGAASTTSTSGARSTAPDDGVEHDDEQRAGPGGQYE